MEFLSRTMNVEVQMENNFKIAPLIQRITREQKMIEIQTKRKNVICDELS